MKRTIKRVGAVIDKATDVTTLNNLIDSVTALPYLEPVIKWFAHYLQKALTMHERYPGL